MNMSADPAAHRILVAHLADDLNWLEDHARSLPEEAPQAGAADGVRVIRVLEAATRSLASGGTPIAL